jgi:large subunit ribosomal protein L7/L12
MSSKNYEKFIEEISAMSVIELADLVKAIEEKFGVSAAMPTMVAVAGGATDAAASAAAEKSEFKVTLKEAGAKKVELIRALRLFKKDLSVTDAKKLVDEAPTVLETAASKEDANKIKEALEAAGAKVELS